MTTKELILARLQNQCLLGSSHKGAHDVTSWLGCVQAQDYAGAKWAIGQRLNDWTDDGVEQAFNDGDILRTHVLRPTWHFVTPGDIRWMLQLTAPRIKAFAKGYDKKLDITPAAIKRANGILAKALKDGDHLTRQQLRDLLKKARLNTDDIRLGFFLMHAELDGVICSGRRKGKQFTYALLDQRAPKASNLKRDEALVALATRYFQSRGPATAQDFAWWSGLTLTDARHSIDLLDQTLTRLTIGNTTYWHIERRTAQPKPASLPVSLLPAYDEFTVGYEDRSAILPAKLDDLTGHGIFRPTLVVDGRIAGTWKRTDTKTNLTVDIIAPDGVKRTTLPRLKKAVDKYGRFAEKEVRYQLKA